MTLALESPEELTDSALCRPFRTAEGTADHTIGLTFSDRLPQPPEDAAHWGVTYRWYTEAGRHTLQRYSAAGMAPQFTYAVTRGSRTEVTFARRYRESLSTPGRPVAALCRGGDRQRRPRPGAARYGDRQRRVLCGDLRHQPERHGFAVGGGPAGAGKRKSGYCVATAGGLCPAAESVRLLSAGRRFCGADDGAGGAAGHQCARPAADLPGGWGRRPDPGRRIEEELTWKLAPRNPGCPPICMPGSAGPVRPWREILS